MATQNFDRQASDKNRKLLWILIACALGGGLGHFLVAFISVKESPFLGRTFYIVVGFGLIAIALIVAFEALRLRLFPKKRKKSKSKPLFLDEESFRNRNTESRRKKI